MKKQFLLIIIFLCISSLIFVGCGVSKLVSQVGDQMSKEEEPDSRISARIAKLNSWSVYEVWVNENISSGFLSKVPNRSASTRIIVAPFYENNTDPVGKNNSKTFERWIKWMQDENSGIYYLAKKNVLRNSTYEEAYQLYKEVFLKSKSECEDIFNNVMLNKELIQNVSKMDDPLRVYMDGDNKYEFGPNIAVISESKRDLEIKAGILRFPGDPNNFPLDEMKLTHTDETVAPVIIDSRKDTIKNEIAQVNNPPMVSESKNEVAVPLSPEEDVKTEWIINWPDHNTIKTDFQPDKYPILNDIINKLLNQPDLHIEVTSYTDKIGAAIFNKTLSEKRAAVIKNYFISKGIEENRIKPVGYGESEPSVDQADKSNRIEFKIIAAPEEQNKIVTNPTTSLAPNPEKEAGATSVITTDGQAAQSDPLNENPNDVANAKPVSTKKKFITNENIIDKIYAGINLSNYVGPDAMEMKYKPTFSVGLSKSLFYLGNLEFIVEAGYSLKSAEQTHGFLIGNPNYNETDNTLVSTYPPGNTATLTGFKIHSVQLGGILKFNIPATESIIPNFFAGFVVNGQIGTGNFVIQKYTSSGSGYYSVFNATDCYLNSREITVGIGVDFAKILGESYRFKVFGVELVYTRGLNTIYKDDTNDIDTWFVNGITKKENKILLNSQISLRLHWGFLLPSKY